MIEIGCGKSHLLYVIFLYIITHPSYRLDLPPTPNEGEDNGRVPIMSPVPIMLFIPSSKCSFNQVLACFSLAFSFFPTLTQFLALVLQFFNHPIHAAHVEGQDEFGRKRKKKRVDGDEVPNDSTFSEPDFQSQNSQPGESYQTFCLLYQEFMGQLAPYLQHPRHREYRETLFDIVRSSKGKGRSESDLELNHRLIQWSFQAAETLFNRF